MKKIIIIYLNYQLFHKDLSSIGKKNILHFILKKKKIIFLLLLLLIFAPMLFSFDLFSISVKISETDRSNAPRVTRYMSKNDWKFASSLAMNAWDDTERSSCRRAKMKKK